MCPGHNRFLCACVPSTWLPGCRQGLLAAPSFHTDSEISQASTIHTATLASLTNTGIWQHCTRKRLGRERTKGKKKEEQETYGIVFDNDYEGIEGTMTTYNT
ncbi:hypothetical protein Pcinc_025588 [Petrolisthes cinctipes]|uniref:Uncharacterized protein n=1 Tax=Petrolisthes cinctipes TaxID=88211 RepID=A0AAE1F8J8_PETCI|nr:hypothetical protein Pcinc_025588 [Petrolisthes cinctipes]